MLTSLLFSREAQDIAPKVRKSFLEGKYYDPEAQDIAGKVRKSMGKDEKPVSAGIYLYQIQAGEYMQTKKMVLLK